MTINVEICKNYGNQAGVKAMAEACKLALVRLRQKRLLDLGLFVIRACSIAVDEADNLYAPILHQTCGAPCWDPTCERNIPMIT